jgi:chromate reductase, NAD(P)H dehydrogenase (quinone)
VRVLGISGSLRRASHNRTLLRAAAAYLPAPVCFREWRGLDSLPAYSEDGDGPAVAAPVVALRRAIAAADALIIATPEYNHSVPGALKNALDWASRPYSDNSLRGTPVAVIGASSGVFGAVWAQAELRKILKAIGADVVDTQLPVALAGEAFSDGGTLRDGHLASELRAIMEELVRRLEERVAA